MTLNSLEVAPGRIERRNEGGGREEGRNGEGRRKERSKKGKERRVILIKGHPATHAINNFSENNCVIKEGGGGRLWDK